MKQWHGYQLVVVSIFALHIQCGLCLVPPPTPTAPDDLMGLGDVPSISLPGMPGLPDIGAPTPEPASLGETDDAELEDGETPEPAIEIPESATQKSSTASSQAEQPAETIEIPNKEIGIQGNWMKKRKWVTKAFEANDEIQKFLVQIQASRAIFNQKFNVIDEELDTFYKTLGVEQGKLEELFLSLTGYLTKRKQQELEALSAQKNGDKILARDYKKRVEEIEVTLRNHKGQLDQLKLDMKSIEELDQSIAKRLKRLDEQIERARSVATQGHTILNKMWDIIDDSIARNRYYEFKSSILDVITSIHTYVTSTLPQDFDKVTGMIQNQINKVKQETGELESQGLIIKNRAQRVDDLKIQIKQEQEAAQKAREAEEKARRELALKNKPRKRPARGFFKSLYANFIDTLTVIYQMVTSPFTSG